MSGSSPGYGNVSTATATVYYRSFTDKETGAATKGNEIYYNDAATGNVVGAKNGSGDYYDWSYNVTTGQLAQSEIIKIKSEMVLSFFGD